MEERHCGIIIRETDVGEADRIITVLTADCGIVRAFARGSKKITGKLFSQTRLFTYGDFIFNKGRDKYVVTSAARKTGFFAKINDIEKLALAQYICELCSLNVPQEQPESDETLRLVLNTFYAIENTDKPLGLIKPSFELRFISALGYCPDLSACGECSKEDGTMYFYPSDGRVLCADCGGRSDGGIKLSPPALTAARYVLFADVEKMFSYSIPPDAATELYTAAERYVIAQTERKYRTLDFYNSLKSV